MRRSWIVRISVGLVAVTSVLASAGCAQPEPAEPGPVSFRRTGVTPSGDRHEPWTMMLDIVASREPTKDEVHKEALSQGKSYMELENLEILEIDVFTEDGERVATATVALTEEGAERTGTPVGEPRVEME